MDFESYLKNKKIDPELFKKGDNKSYKEWEQEYQETHPKSFTANKLYLINAMRRIYNWKGKTDKAVRQK